MCGATAWSRQGVTPAVAQFGQELRAHHAKPAEFEHVPAGQGDPDRERLRFGDRRNMAERDAQHAAPVRREHPRAAGHLDVGPAVLARAPVRTGTISHERAAA